MRGSIKQRGRSWLIQVYTGKDASGKPTRYYETVKGRKGDAQRRLTELLASLDKGIPTPASKLTVAEHLQNWLNGYVSVNCSPRTLDGYRAIVEKYLIPNFGHLLLKQLTPKQYNHTMDKRAMVCQPEQFTTNTGYCIKH